MYNLFKLISREEAIQEEGAITQRKIAEAIELGSSTIQGSALVETGKEIGPDEVSLTRQLLETIAPPNEDNQRFYAHLELTAKFARMIGERLDMNPYELEVMGLLHDVGRFFTHRYYRNDLLGDLFLRKLGLRNDLLKKMPSLRGYVGPKVYREIEDLSVSQRIIGMADFCGKRKSDGDIYTFDEAMAYHRSSGSRYEDLTGLRAIWPSERYAFRHMLPDEEGRGEGITERSAKIYEEIRDWLKNQGVDVERLRLEILEKESRADG